MAFPERNPCPVGLRIRLLCFILPVLAFLLVPACGKKAAPTLASYEKPPAPSLLRVLQRENKMFLSWSYPSDKEQTVSGFIILRASGSGFEKIALPEKNLRVYIDADVKEGMTYTYKILARNLRGVLSPDSNSVAVGAVTPPGPPVSIIWSISDDSLLLSWEKTGEDIAYNVYKTAEKGVYAMTPVNKFPLFENFFRDALSLDRPVYYTVRSMAKTGGAEGASSREIAVSPYDLIPSVPHDVRYFAAPDKIYLYWKGPDAPWITGFRIYRRFAAGEYALIAETHLPSFLDKDSPSARRDYRITAVGPFREGPAAEINGVLYVPE